jgi:hypothetical protein
MRAPHLLRQLSSRSKNDSQRAMHCDSAQNATKAVTGRWPTFPCSNSPQHCCRTDSGCFAMKDNMGITKAAVLPAIHSKHSLIKHTLRHNCYTQHVPEPVSAMPTMSCVSHHTLVPSVFAHCATTKKDAHLLAQSHGDCNTLNRRRLRAKPDVAWAAETQLRGGMHTSLYPRSLIASMISVSNFPSAHDRSGSTCHTRNVRSLAPRKAASLEVH